jgi:hypothetical protein
VEKDLSMLIDPAVSGWRALTLSFAFLAGCGVPELDPERVAGQIRAELEGQHVTVTSVSCPAGVAKKSGQSFACTGVSSRGDAFTVDVAQTDDQGGLKLSLRGKIFDPEAYAARALKHFTDGRKVDCGTGKFIAVATSKLTCTVEGQSPVTLSFSEDGSIDEAGVGPLLGGKP